VPGPVGQRGVKQRRAVAAAVVGEDLLDGDAVGCEEGDRPAQEPGRGDGAFVGEGLRERDPGMGVDRGVPVPLADPLSPRGLVLGTATAMHPPAAASRDRPDLLYVGWTS